VDPQLSLAAIGWSRGPLPDASVRRPSLRVLAFAALSSEAPSKSAGGDERAHVTEPAELDDVVRRAQRGDKAAFAELFRRHRGDVSRLVFRMLGPSADIEDVVQEVFLQVHRSLGDFRGQAKFSTWLHRVTVHVVLMVRRAARSRPVFSGEISTDHEADHGLLPDEEAARRARIAAFRRLLDRLSEKKRTVFILHEIEGKLPAEIAEIVDAPVLTVRTRLFYARRELAQMMREEPALAQLVDDVDADEGVQLRRKQAETEVT